MKYHGSIWCKHGSMKGKTRERTVQGMKMFGSLEHIKETPVNMEVTMDGTIE